MSGGLRAFATQLVTIGICATAMPGCAAISQHVAGAFDALAIRAKEHRDLAAIRHDTRAKLAAQRADLLRAEAEREVALARVDAEQRQLESEFCVCNQEQVQRQLQQKLKQTVESKVAFQVEQGLEIGELQVNVEALKQLLEKREQEQQVPPVQEQKQPCPCCDQPCGCRPGLLRRHCPICCVKPCEAEKKCGGPETLSQLQQQPQKQPLRPAEIPMMLPVRLTYGFQQPQMEQAQVRRRPPEQPQKQVCCPHCGLPPDQCHCPTSCVDPVRNNAPPGASAATPPNSPGQPPTPEPDSDLRASSEPWREQIVPTMAPIVDMRTTAVPRKN